MGERTAPVDRRDPAVIGFGTRPVQRLSAAEALRENGFAVTRQAFASAEVAALADRLKGEAGIGPRQRFASEDATNRFPAAQDLMFDERVLHAVRVALGGPARFLQVSDLHHLRDAPEWHRDSVHRAQDASSAPDWSAAGDGDTFGVVKAIVYLESENAGLAVMAGSHNRPFEIDHEHTKRLEKARNLLLVDDDVEPNQRLTRDEQRFPLVWQARAGDVLVFDERLYHCGRRIEDDGRVHTDREAPKLTLSFVFGIDNRHSERLYSYFRYARRDLAYRELHAQLRDRLAEHDLVLRSGWGNYYESAPDELRDAWLRQPETLDMLVAEFRSAGHAT